MADAEVVTDVKRLEALADDWDSLAIAAGRPYCAPGWQLPWWRNAAPPGAELRAVVLTEQGAVVGLAPLFFQPRGGGAYRFLGAGDSSPLEPLARPGQEANLAAAAVRMTRAAPAAISFDGVPATSEWPELLAASWTSPVPAVTVEQSMPAPAVDCSQPAFDRWLAGKSGHFRKRLRASRRRIEERGGSFVRAATPGEATTAVAAFAQLHRAQWSKRGLRLMDERRERMLASAAESLGPDRLRVWTVVADDRVVAAEVLVAAGGVVSAWQGAFDPDWAPMQPSFQTLLRALEHSFEAGDRVFDLGPGGQEYKYRIADRDAEMRWISVIPRGRGYAVRRARRALPRLRRAVLARVPTTAKAAVKRAARRLEP